MTIYYPLYVLLLLQVPDSDLLTVQAGDFLAVKEESASLQIINSPASAFEYYFDVDSDNTWGDRATNGYTLTFSNNDPMLSAAHAIRAHLVQPVKLKFRHTYADNGINRRNITVTASNNVSSMSANASIELQALIQNVSIWCNYTAGKSIFCFHSLVCLLMKLIL